MSNKVNVMIGTEGKQRSVTRVFIFFFTKLSSTLQLCLCL